MSTAGDGLPESREDTAKAPSRLASSVSGKLIALGNRCQSAGEGLVSHPSRRYFWLLSSFALLVLVFAPLTADAQRRGRNPGPTLRTSVVIVSGIGYPRYGFYDPWYDPWYQYPYPRRYPPYGPYGDDEFSSALRIEVTPKQAQVFVDGYYAGEVDDFDGVFQRLRLRPGGHEIAIYLQGYRTLRHAMYVHPGSTERIRDAMEPLGPGETSELPAPAAGSSDANRPGEIDRPGPRAPGVREAPARFGTLRLRVQPGDAEILVDGERWSTSAAEDQVAIRLPEGRHRVEVRREGFARYVEDVLIRIDRTLTLNVSLTPGGERN